MIYDEEQIQEYENADGVHIVDFQSQQNTHKKCPMCCDWLPLEEFHKSKRSKDGHAAYCKECHSFRCQKYYQEKNSQHKKI